jgi:DNA-binding MarR family transcriptional regulator
MDTREAAHAFNERFMRVYQRYYRRVRPGSYRPGRESLAVLRHLHRAGPLTVGEAAGHFSRSQAATSEIVTRLESHGLIARVTDGRDRRRTLVWLTERGIEMLEESHRVLSLSKLVHAFEQLPPAEREGVVEALGQLLATDTDHGGWDDE